MGTIIYVLNYLLVCTTFWLTKLKIGLPPNTCFPTVFANGSLGLLCRLKQTSAYQESKLQIHAACIFKQHLKRAVVADVCLLKYF